MGPYPLVDRQEGHYSADIVELVSQIRNIFGHSAPSESRKIRGFRTSLDSEDHPYSNYRLPVGDASLDILADMMITFPCHLPGCDIRRYPSSSSIQVFVVISITNLKGGGCPVSFASLCNHRAWRYALI